MEEDFSALEGMDKEEANELLDYLEVIVGGSIPIDREEGIKAFIALQAMAGIEASEEEAAIGWDNFDLEDKERTIIAYHAFCC